jgi:hypothetical protein
MGERNQDGGYGEGRDASSGAKRTTVGAEDARREAAEREQREHPELFTGRDRDPNRDDSADLDASAPIDADDDSERFRARENEDVSEG